MTNIDYVATYFELPKLDKIHGALTYAKLRDIKDQIKANTSSVSSELGGGAHYYLWLGITDGEYVNITATPYICPAHPGPMEISVLMAQHLETRMREDHKALIQVFREATDLQKAVIKQNIKTIDPIYIKTLRERNMNTIQANISTVLAYLFTTYGTIEPEVLREREPKVLEMTYTLMDLLVTIYNEIEELEHLGVAAINPYSQSHIVSYELVIIKNTNDFETGIRTWITRLPIEHMWSNFRIHFEEVHRVLRAVHGTTKRLSAYHHANILDSQVLLEVKNIQDNVL